MIKCEVTKPFTLGRYKELKNVVKVITRNENEFGNGDIFECSEDMAKYLMGENANKDVVVKILEVIPEEVKEETPKEEVEVNQFGNPVGTREVKPKKKKTSKK